MTERTQGLDVAAEHARRFLDGLDERFVGPRVPASELRAALGGPLPEDGEDAAAVLDALASAAEPGLVATAGPRHFGFVMGGALPAAIGADWLSAAWDQSPAFYVLSPAGAVIEEVTAGWLVELFGLPSTTSVGFVTGGQGANTTCLAAARHRVLRDAGWDVERDGLQGAPRVRVLIGDQAHVTVGRSLRLLGLGEGTARRVGADDQGRMRPDALRAALREGSGPTIVCAQAGNVATGAFDPFDEIADLCDEHAAWLHVDGAFGLWAAAVPSLEPLTAGLARASSWGVDAHKWLNVPYDCAMALIDDEDAHTGAMSMAGPYLVADPEQRDSTNYVPESSRRARAMTVYAALRSLGRAGVVDMIERNCAHARRMAAALRGAGEILNDVVLNQVLVRFPGGDERNRRIVADVQRDGTCWLGGTQYGGEHVMRISFTNWSTTDEDVDRSAAAILRASARA
jgi:glutamate/tyrosine decarboxylase-like PLP-dependent enzyme